jgi:hypothetical protein
MHERDVKVFLKDIVPVFRRYKSTLVEKHTKNLSVMTF